MSGLVPGIPINDEGHCTWKQGQLNGQARYLGSLPMLRKWGKILSYKPYLRWWTEATPLVSVTATGTGSYLSWDIVRLQDAGGKFPVFSAFIAPDSQPIDSCIELLLLWGTNLDPKRVGLESVALIPSQTPNHHSHLAVWSSPRPADWAKVISTSVVTILEVCCLFPSLEIGWSHVDLPWLILII